MTYRTMLIAALVCHSMLTTIATAEEWGSVTGTILFEGEIPELQPLVEEGQPRYVGTEPVPDESLIIDPKTKGIANVFVYVNKVPAIHPDAQAIPEQTLVTTIDEGRYAPHAMTIRVGAGWGFKSMGTELYNPHLWPLRNDAYGCGLGLNHKDIQAIRTFEKAEILPIRLTCDIHPWMSAHLLILDHPYMQVTSTDGKFELKNLPAGEHTIRVWHERAGYLFKQNVIVKANETIDLELKPTTVKDFRLEK